MKIWAMRNWSVFGPALGVLFTVAGCLSPIALHRAVVEYDRATAQIQAEMLLLNIARSKHLEPLHFTAVSSVAATFGFTAAAGITPTGTETGSLVAPFFNARVTESPTITIIPIEGEEFTKRILSPISARKVAFQFQQGVEPAILLRLMAQVLVVQKEKGFTILHNNPLEAVQYIEFRRRVLHISSLNLSEALYVGPIFYEETLPISFPKDSGSPEVLQALDKVLDAEEKGYRWKRLTEAGPLVLTKNVVGRLVIANYDVTGLPNEERRQLNDAAKSLPENSIIIDIRTGHSGGDYPLQGHFIFRSFSDVLKFAATGISTIPEFEVEKDKRTGLIPPNPTHTIEIEETENEPADAAFKVKHRDTWYWIKRVDPKSGEVIPWNQNAFRTLSELYQMTVTDVSRAATPVITIAK